MDDQIKKAALALIQAESTLTLATVDRDGPWSAPVFYVFLDGRFYFFSSPNSRHIRSALTTRSAAASVYHEGNSWQSLKGLQMTGKIQLIDTAAVSMKAVGVYLKRFGFVSDFFKGGCKPTAKDFFSRFNVRLYAFTPAKAYFVDNRQGFGSRQHITLR